jgi:hypothetical protein
MNTLDVLKYGHATVLKAVDGLPDDAWETGGVCGTWSSKDVIVHLASFEQVLVEVLRSQLDAAQPTPTLERFRTQSTFNDDEVAARKGKRAAEVLAEYEACHAEVMALSARLPAERFHQSGILPWYGAEYDLDDFIVYTFYGHKREHSAQIKLFRKRLGQ